MVEKDGSRGQMVPFWLPLLLTGYLETLRIAVFYAFGWEWSGLLLCVSLLISINTCRQVCKTSRIGNVLTLAVVVVFTTLAGFYHRLLDSAVVFSYAVMVFFVYSLILERKSAREVFILGTFLSLNAAVASDQGIRVYLILNLLFAFGLQSQLHLLSLEINSRLRSVKHSGINGGFLNRAVLAVILLGVLIAVLMPTAEGMTGGWAFLHQKIGGGYFGGRSGVDSDFWRRLQNFDFNGDVPLGVTPVLMVTADQPSYWRGEAADYYTGSGWQNSMVIRAVNENDYINHYPGILPLRKMEQVFTFLPGYGSENIYFAGSPIAVSISNSSLAADDGGNFYSRSFATGLTYRVVSDMIDFRSDRLKTVSGEYPPEILEKYLQLPRIPGRVRELAQKLTITALTPYDKAKKIEAYLSSHYPYETKVIPPTGKQDVVDYFLFDLKKGYCTYHSTAMVVMLRSIGIPSRWVTGFTAGSFSKDKGAYIVTMKDAHAWVEVYIPGAGWVPFEPTSSFVIPSNGKLSSALNTSSKKAAVQNNKPHFSAAALRTNLPWPGFGILIRSAGVGLIIIFVIATAVSLVSFGKRRKRARNNDYKFDTVEEIYQVFLKLIAQKGYHKSADQTPLEFAACLCAQDTFVGCSDQIMYVTNAYLRHRFSLDKLNSDEANELKRVLKDLSVQLGIKKLGLTSYQ